MSDATAASDAVTRDSKVAPANPEEKKLNEVRLKKVVSPPKKRKYIAYNHAAHSPRKTRSSDFYTSMVAEAIKQSELESKLKKDKTEKNKDYDPLTQKKASKVFSRLIPHNFEFEDKDSPDDIKIGSRSANEEKKKQKKDKRDKKEDAFRTFGELKSVLKNSTTVELAKKIIGVNICRRVDGQKLIGKIVDTEAYIGTSDQCSITYKKKKSKGLKSYFEDAGACCVEFLESGGRQVAISSALPGEYVLIRALQPMLGRDKMKSLRGLKSILNDKDLAKGPTETCQALKVGLDHDCLDLLEGGGDLWIEPGANCPNVIKTRRVLDMHDEKNWNQWSFKKYRFYDPKSTCINSRDMKEDRNLVKQADSEMEEEKK